MFSLLKLGSNVIIFFLCFRLVHTLQVESAEGNLPFLVVLVGHDHCVERVAVQGVDVGAGVLKVGRPGSAEGAVVTVRVLDFGRRLFPRNEKEI